MSHELKAEARARVHILRVLVRLLPYFLGQKRLVTIAGVGLLINAATHTAVPWMIKIAIDRYISVGDLSGLSWFFAIFVGNAALGWVTNIVAQVSLYRATQNVLYAVRSQLVSHLQRQSVSFYDKNPVGSLMSRVLGDVDQIQELFLSAWVVGPLLHLVGIVVAVLVLDLRLGLIAMSVVPGMILFVVIWQPHVTRAFAKQRQAEASFSQALNEQLAGVRVIQSMNRQQRAMEIVESLNRRTFSSALFARRLSELRHIPRGLIQGVSIGLAVFFGAMMVSTKSIELGTFVAIALYIQRFFQPLHVVLGTLTPFNQAMASGMRVFDMMDTIPDATEPTSREMLSPLVNARVEFRDVSYSYIQGQKVLKNVSLTIEPGQLVAIVGPTGAGKTTLVSLLCRLYELPPKMGSILLDGHDIRSVPRSWLARQIGFVLQDPLLFSGTVRDNIRYNRTDVTDGQIEEAARAVGADNFILDLEHGYDTFLRDGGTNLSLGQRQQLCFARAIVGAPRILVVDEATSRVDSATDEKIQKTLHGQLRNRAVIVIAHRLSTIRKANKIVVLNHGEVVEQGTHLELVGKRGLYARLYDMNYAALEGALPTAEND